MELKARIDTASEMELPLADWTRTIRRSVLRQMIAVVSRPGVLSFAGGLPATELFPRADYAAALAKVLLEDPRALQYGPPSHSLKQHITRLMARRGVSVSPEQVFITTGAQQALNVLVRLFLNKNGPIILEETVYTGMQQAVAPWMPQVYTVPTDRATGMDVNAVEAWLTQGVAPAFIYVISEAHNPLGVSLSLEKRHRLVELARRYRVPIIEDDPYGFLVYDREPDALPPLRALDERWVFYVGSFSKILAPALRLGWTIAPEGLVDRLTVIKEAIDLETSALTQRAVAAYLDTGKLPAHLETIRQAYRQRRDTMLAALAGYFPASACWTRPDAGLFIWVEFPPEVDCASRLPLAVEQEGVAFIPGHAFSLPGGRSNHNAMRLSFSNCPVEQIEDGLCRLARVFA